MYIGRVKLRLGKSLEPTDSGVRLDGDRRLAFSPPFDDSEPLGDDAEDMSEGDKKLDESDSGSSLDLFFLSSALAAHSLTVRDASASLPKNSTTKFSFENLKYE